MKRYLEGLQAVHDFARTLELAYEVGSVPASAYADALAQNRSCVHPVVRRHPKTGRLSLYINPTYTVRIEGVAPTESRAILALLFEHATRSEFIARHHWRKNDVVMWDNRSIWHKANRDVEGPRVLHRVSVLGDARPSL